MSEVTLQNSSKSVRVSSECGLETALAAHVRKRWQVNTVAAVMIAWDLTEGEAKGVVYGTASRSTINKVLRHKRGRLRLGLALLEDVCDQKLGEFINEERERAANARQRFEADEHALAEMARSLPSVLGLDVDGSDGDDFRPSW